MQAKDVSVFKIITVNVSACQKRLNFPALCLKTWYRCLLRTTHWKDLASQICKHCWQSVMDDIAKFARCLSFHTADILRNGLRNSKPLWETVIPPTKTPALFWLQLCMYDKSLNTNALWGGWFWGLISPRSKNHQVLVTRIWISILQVYSWTE